MERMVLLNKLRVQKAIIGSLFISMVLLVGCSTDDPVAKLNAEFSYTASSNDGNTIHFENTTKGDVYYIRWNFGNGDRTDRIPLEDGATMTTFYPEPGDYTVEMTVWGDKSDLANNSTVTQTISIDQAVFQASFTVDPKAGAGNMYVLTNTTTGSYDEIAWVIDGELHSGTSDLEEVYLPLAGNYSVQLQVKRNEYTKEVNKTVNVATEDPDFLSHFELVWSDEFDGSAVDNSKWSFETGQHGWGNSEWQNYTNGANSEVADGKLSIIAKKVGTGQKVGDYTSSRMNSKESFTYGKMEIRAKMPDYKGPGHWPAIWMLGKSIQSGTSWPLCGEIDIMEYVSWDPNKTSSSIHIQSNNHANGNPIGSGHIDAVTAEEEFHVYGLLWTKRYLKFYRDTEANVILEYKRPNNFTKENWPFDDPFYFLMNIAVGGTYGGVSGVNDDIFPATMEVDYVRVYQYKAP